ncbi:MAG: hypothetical protein C0502_05145 [Opitutus sp.]|nr:hypothetical protein [Opitutus sp.]
MKKQAAKDLLPSSAIGRFAIGFAVAALIAFFAIALLPPAHDLKSAALAALVFGSAAGIVSACGKRWLNLVIGIFTRFGF